MCGPAAPPGGGGSPGDLEERLDRVHLRQRGVSVRQLDGGDAQGPHVTAGVVGVVVLLLARDHLGWGGGREREREGQDRTQ